MNNVLQYVMMNNWVTLGIKYTAFVFLHSFIHYIVTDGHGLISPPLSSVILTLSPSPEHTLFP